MVGTLKLNHATLLAIATVATLVLGACKPAGTEKAAAPPTKTDEPKSASEPTATPVAPFKGIAAGAGMDPAGAPRVEDKPPTVEFAVPRTVAVGKSDDVSFVIQSATIEPRNPESVRLVLLVRLSNRSGLSVNFWDSSFRLLTHNSTIPASGGLNALVDARSDSMLERVQFVVPLTSAPRALKIDHGGESVELPLRFL